MLLAYRNVRPSVPVLQKLRADLLRLLLAVNEPVIGPTAQPVMDMNRNDLAHTGAALPRQPRENVEQRSRVAAARVADDDHRRWLARNAPPQCGAIVGAGLRPGLGVAQRLRSGLEKETIERISLRRSCS